MSPAFLGVAEGLPGWHRAVGRGQGGTVSWEALGSLVHALGVAAGFFLCQGQGERSRWIFRAMSCVGTSHEHSQGSAGKGEEHAAPNCWEDKGVDGWDETPAATQGVGMPPRLVATWGEEHGAYGPYHT